MIARAEDDEQEEIHEGEHASVDGVEISPEVLPISQLDNSQFF